MVNKKIWAYATGGDGNYIVGEKHPLRIFYIWEALRIRNQRIHEFQKLTFWSTQRDPTKRDVVVPVINGFFRYHKSGRGVMTDNFDKDGASLSHSIAIQVIAELEVIPFVVCDKSIPLKVKNIRTDDLKIQLPNRDKFEYYYPDLICEFSEPEELALKWGGKVAIEVKHWHPCEREKCYDFEAHGVPIIEVNIENISIEKWYREKSFSPEVLEEYYSRLKKMFKERIYGRILSDPISKTYHKIVLKKEQDRSAKALEKVDKVQGFCTRLIEHQEHLGKERAILLAESHKLEERLIQLETEIVNINQRGFGFYLRRLLRSFR